MTAKIQRNLGLIGVSAKDQRATRSGISDFTSQRLYQKTDLAVEVYGYQGSVAHAVHSSTSVSSTISLGTAYSDREVYIIVSTMSGANGGFNQTPVSGVTVGSQSFTSLYQTTQTTEANACAIAFYRYVDSGSLGTSASYTVTFNNEQVHSGIMAFTTGPTASANVGTFGVSSATTSWGSGGTIATADGGFVLFSSIAQNASAPSGTYVTGYTNGVSFDTGSTEYVVLAHQEDVSIGTVTVPQPNYTPAGDNAFAAISRES